MTDADWNIVAEALKGQFKTVHLMCDGYEVCLALERSGQYKLAISVYVNGWFKGEWFKHDENPSEEARRFFPTHYINCYSVKQKKLFSKYPFGKKYCKENGINRPGIEASFY